MKRILVIGSMNMDFVMEVSKMPRVGETILSKGVQLIPGGKGANQAYAAGKLGGDVSMLGAVGRDEYGKALCESLKSVNADVAFVKEFQGSNTGTAIICVDETGDNSIIVNQEANGLVDVVMIDENTELIENSDIIVLQLEIPIETVIYAAKKAKELGKTVILDPAPARLNLPAELLACVDIIKPNETELEILSGIRGDMEGACRVLHEKGAKSIIVTLGDKGAVLYRGGEITSFPCEKKVKAVDTTAAGDSFTAALALGLAKGEILERAIHFAGRVSVMTVTKKGAQTSIPTVDEVEKFFG